MARLRWWVNSAEVALVASTAKSVLQIKAATNTRVAIRKIIILGKQPAGGTDTPIKVRMTRNTANFGTFTGATLSKNDPNDGETIQTTAGGNASVEPTSPTDGGLWWEVQPQIGIIDDLVLDKEIIIPGGQSVQFECTSTGTPTVLITVMGEE